MYKISLLFVLILTTFSLTRCKSQDSVIQKKVPFTITEKTYQHWIGGKEGSSGTNLVLRGKYDLSPLHFDTVFFQNREEKIAAEFNSNIFTIFLRIATIDSDKANLKMSKDPKDEFGNPVPVKTKNIPFDLKEDEAVLLYNVKGKEYYYKISGIKKLETVYYP
jgi:hypothetical protein